MSLILLIDLLMCIFCCVNTLLHVPFRIDRGASMTGRSLRMMFCVCVRLEHVPQERQRAINEPIKGMRCVFMTRRAVNHPGLQCPRAVSRMCWWIYCYCSTIKVTGMWRRISGKRTCCKNKKKRQIRRIKVIPLRCFCQPLLNSVCPSYYCECGSNCVDVVCLFGKYLFF